MSDFLVLGTGGNMVDPDGAASWDASLEAGNFATLVTKAFSPQGVEGDAVFRRVYLTVEHKGGVSIAATPLLDGEVLQESSQYLSRPVHQMEGRERHSFVLPLFRAVANRPGSAGARGTTLQLQIACYSPNEDWWLEHVGFTYVPGTTAKQKES